MITFNPEKRILRRAAQIIANPDNWTQHALARNRLEMLVYSNSPEATKFCAAGAIRRAVTEAGDLSTTARQAAERASQRLFNTSLVGVNDDIGRQSALVVLKEAEREL